MSEDFAYLNEERIKLWSAVRDIEAKLNDLIKNTPLKLQQEARGQLNKASEYCNRISDRKTEADSKFSGIMQLLSTIQNSAESLSQKLNDVNERYQQAQEQFAKINEAYEVVSSSNEEWDQQVTLMDQNYDTTNEWIKTAKEQAEKVQTIHVECESNAKKINVLLTQAADKKQEITDIYDEIFGYDYKDENTNEDKHEDGLEKELSKAYDDLTKKLTEYNEILDSFKAQKEKQYNDFLQFKKDEHESIHNKIKSLLPGALT